MIGGQARRVRKLYAVVNGTTRRIKKTYDVINGVTRMAFAGKALEYTGDFTVERIYDGGNAYDLYTLLTSGTLKLNEDAMYWMCGGGQAGNKKVSAGRAGSGGHGGHFTEGELAGGNYTVVIGAGAYGSASVISGGDTTIDGKALTLTAAGGGISASVNSGSGTIWRSGASTGGSGGCLSNGNVHVVSASSAYEISTIPFGLSDLKEHCAGGGGGAVKWTYTTGFSSVNIGGAGGSNGGSGSSNRDYKSPYESGSIIRGGSGGIYGGGAGGGIRFDGMDGIYYGAGGGGEGASYNEITSSVVNDVGYRGYGYQGVCYILIKAGDADQPDTGETQKEE